MTLKMSTVALPESLNFRRKALPLSIIFVSVLITLISVGSGFVGSVSFVIFPCNCKEER